MSIAELFYAKQLARQARRLALPRRRPRLLPRWRKILLEPLEPRLLLSTTLSCTLPDAEAFTLRLTADLAPEIQILDADSHVVAHQALSETGGVEVLGSSGNDSLTIDMSRPFALAGGISVDLGGGKDSIVIRGDGEAADLLSLGAAGLDLTAESITLESTAQIATSGDITLTAEARLDLGSLDVGGMLEDLFSDPSLCTLDTIISGFIDDVILGSTHATICVEGASLSAHDITLDADATVTGTTTGLFRDDIALPIPGFAAALANVHAKASVLIDGATLDASANLDIDATSLVDATASAAPAADEANTNPALDAAVAVSVVDSQAIAKITGTTGLSVDGTIDLTATNAVEVTTIADGSTGGSAAAGGSVALAFVTTTTEAAIDGNAFTSGDPGTLADGIGLHATSWTDVTTRATATAGGSSQNESGTQEQLSDINAQSTGGGSIGVAGALALSDTTTSNQAYLDSDGTITSAGLVSAQAVNDTDSSAVADGSTTGSGATGVGVAVAVNLPTATNQAYVGGRVTAGGVTITAGMNPADPDARSAFTAAATSGAGATDVGVAGAFALNLAKTSTQALLRPDAVVGITGAGDAVLGAANTTTASTTAQPEGLGGSGGSVGVGASVAITISDNTTMAALQGGSALTGASDLTLIATSSNTATTTAKTGAQATESGGAGIGGAIAIAVVNSDTTAQLGTGPALDLTGDLLLGAAHTGTTTTTADGEASGGSAGIGIALALTTAADVTTATTLRTLDVGGNAGFSAIGASATGADAKASATGAATDSGAGDSTVDSQVQGQRDSANARATSGGARSSDGAGATPSASTSGGPVSVAAGIAINIATVETRAYVPDSGEVTVGGMLALGAEGNADAAAAADGSATAMPSKTVTFDPAATGVVDAGADTITVGSHAWRTGDQVTYSSSGTAIGGLQDGKTYYVIPVSGQPTKIKLATSAQNASSGTAINLTSGAAGTGHTLSGADNSSGVGVGAAVALNLADVTTEGSIGTGAHVSAGSVSLSATMAPRAGEDTPAHTFGAAAKAGAGNADIGVAGAVAINIVNLDSSACIKAGAQVTLTGTGGANDASLTAAAVTASAAVAEPTTTGGVSGGSVGIGASVALNIVDCATTAELGSTAVLTGANDLTLTASSSNTVATTAKAGAAATSTGSSGSGGSGGVGVGAAVAISTVTNDTTAQVGSGSTLGLSGNLGATATHTGVTKTLADGTVSQGSSAAIGAAIAFGIATDTTTATTLRPIDVDGAAAFTAEAATVSTADAKATARGGAPSSSAGGSTVDSQAAGQRSFANTQADNSGSGARSSSGAAATPSASTSGGGVTVAAGIAINIAGVKTRAYIPDGGNATVSGALSLSAKGKGDALANADGSATGKSTSDGVGVGAAVALNLADVATEATIGTNAVVTAGSLSLETGMLETEKPFGLSAVKIDGDAIELGAGSGLKTGDAVVYEKGAAGNVAVGGLQDGKTYYITVDDTRSFNPKIGVNPLDNTIDVGQNHLLQTGDKVVYTTGKAGNSAVTGLTNGATYVVEVVDSSHIKLKDPATGTVQSISPTLDTSFSNNQLTIVNPTRVKLAATAQDALAGKAIDLTAGGTGSGHHVIDRSHHFRAEAAAGAGSSDVSVAGSVAINIVAVDATAAIQSGATVTVDATQGGSGDVSLMADSVNTNAAIAEPTMAGGAAGGSVGVGASVALNIVGVTTKAEVADTAVLRNAAAGITDINSLALGATSLDTVITTAKAGGAAAGGSGGSGGVGVGAGVGIAIVANETVADLGDNAGAVSLRGDVAIAAEHTGGVVTAVGSKAAGSSAAVGAAVGVNIVTDTTTARTGRSLASSGASGTVTIRATGIEASTMEVEASAQGSKGSGEGGKQADQQAGDEVNQSNVTSRKGTQSLPSADGNVNSANSQASGQSGQSGGTSGVGVAAAVGVTVVTVNNEASIAADTSVTTGGHVTLSAAGETDASTKALGASLSTSASNNIGAAVGVNVATVTNQALLGENATVSGSGITVEAVTPTGESNDFTVWGLAAAGGKGNAFAGSVGVNVVTFTTQASAGTSADLDSTGSITFTAGSAFGIQNVAGAAGVGKGVGVGAAVAVNVVTSTTEAFVASGTASGEQSYVDASGTFTVQATSTQVPLTVDLPLVDEADDPEVTGIAMAGGLGTGDAAVGGSLVVNVFTLNTHAYLGQGIHVNDTKSGANQSIVIQASDTTILKGGAGGLGATTGSAGIGIGLDVGVITKDTRAYIGPSATAHAAKDATIQATSSQEVFSVAVAGGVADSAGVGGAVSVQVLTTGTRAYIDSALGQVSAVHAGGNLAISASDTADIDMIAGGLGVASTAGIGVGNTTLVHGDTVEAYINPYASIEAKGSTGLSLSAVSAEDVMTIAVAGGGAGTAGVAGSVTVNVLTETTRAFIGRGAVVAATNASGSINPGVSLTASDDTTVLSIAGSVSFGGTAGVGAGVDVEVLTKTTEAYVGKAADVDADLNVSVTADASEDILSIPVSGAVGGTAGVAGSFGVSVLTLTTKAYVEDGTSAADRASITAGGTVAISASDESELDIFAGNIAGGGTVGVGIAAAVPVVTKTVEAYIGAWADVDASAGGSGLTVKTGGFGAPAYTLNPVFTGNPTVAFALNGSDADTITRSSGSWTTDGYKAGQAIEIRGTADTNGDETGENDGTYVIDHISGDGRTLYLKGGTNAKGLSRDESIAGSSLTIHMVADETGAIVAAPATATDMSGDGTSEFSNDPSQTGKRSVSATTGALQGVAVTAVNQDIIRTYGLTGGAAGTVAVNVGGSVQVTTVTTRAHINTSADVDTSGSVTVAAGYDFQNVGVAAGISISGTVSVTPSVAVGVATLTTEASIDDGADVDAGGDIRVTARSTQDILAIAAGVAGSGAVSVGGSIPVTVLTTTTRAFIGDDATSDLSGAKATAGGNILVSAVDDTDVDMIAGSLGVGGAAGIGASVGVTVITKDTSAFVGDYATVDARGNTAGTLSDIYTGDFTGGGAFATESGFKGLAVQAASSENLLSITVAGGGGFYAGIGGGITVEVLDSDTRAYIGEYANVNATAGTEGASQSVSVSAVNDAKVIGIGGGLGIGIAGIGGGVDVGILRNDTAAYIGNHAEVEARKDVDVNALAKKDVNTYALSVGGGVVGVAGSVSVWTIGGGLQSDYTTDEGKPSEATEDSLGSGSGSVLGFADTQAGGTDPDNPSGQANNGYTSILGGFQDDGDRSSHEVASRTAATGSVLSGSAPSGRVQGAVAAPAPTAVPDGTVAFIGSDAQVTADGDVGLRAEERLAFDGIAGNLSGGVGAIGASIIIATVNSNVEAYVDDGAMVRAGSDGGDNILVRARFTDAVNGSAYAGQVGAVALGAQVVVLTDTTTVRAYVDSSADINRAGGTLDIEATSDRGVSAQAVGGGFGAVAAGAAIAVVDIGGSVQAFIGSADVGQASGESVGNIKIAATSDVIADADAWGVQAGIGGLAANAVVATATIDPTVQASIGNDAEVEVTGGIQIEAKSLTDADSYALGVAVSGVGAAIGVAVATASATPQVTASIGTGATIEAGGGIGLRAMHNYTYDPNTKTYSRESSKKTRARATAGSGSLLAAVSGAIASAESSPVLNAQVGSSASLEAGSGDVSLAAKASNDVDAQAIGATAGAVGVGAPVATAQIGGKAWADLDGGVTQGNALEVSAQSWGHADADTIAGSIGLAALQVNRATATITTDTDASVGSTGHLSVSGAITVAATSDANADGDAVGASGGFAGVGLSLAQATASGPTRAHLDGSVGTGASLTITATANNDADAMAKAVSFGAYAIGGADADATVAPSVLAAIGSSGSARDLTVTGPVAITAQHLGDADATATGTTVGATVGAGGSIATAVMTPTVTASVGANAHVSSSAGGISVRSLHNYTTGESAAVAVVGALAQASSGGLVSGSGADADAIASGAVEAAVASGATLSAAQDIRLLALGYSSADADSQGIGAGAVGVGVSLADAVAGGTFNGSTFTAAPVKAHLDGTVTGGASLSVTTTAQTYADADAWALSAGLVSGAGADATAHVAPIVAAGIGGGGHVSGVTGVTITAQSLADGDATASGYSGAVAGAAGSVAGATVAPDIDAYIGSTAGTATSITAGSGGISLKALHNYTTAGATVGNVVSALAEASSGGLVTGSGADADAVAAAGVETAVRSGATLSAPGGPIALEARAYNKADAEAAGVGGGLVGVGASLADAAAGGTASGGTVSPVTIAAHLDGTVSGGGSLTITTTAQTYADADAQAVAVGGVASGSGADADAVVKPNIRASIGGSGRVTVSGGVSLQIQESSDALATASGVSAGAGVSIGESGANASLTPDLETYIGGGAIVTSTSGSIDLTSLHNYAGSSAQTSNDATAEATASGGALVGITGADADATANAAVDTYVGSGATLTATVGGVSLTSRSYNDASASADGDTGAFVAVGEVAATATASGSSKSYLGGIGTLTAGGALTVLAKGESVAAASADASTGGAVDLREPTVLADAAPSVQSYVASSGLMDVGSADIKAITIGDATADADGTGGGIYSEGTSSSTAKWRPTVEAYIGGGATQLEADGSISVQALNNYDDSGTTAQSGRRARAEATASGGGVASVQGADADAQANATVKARILAGASVAAGIDLNLIAKSRNKTEAYAYGVTGGFISAGSSGAYGTMYSTVWALTEDASASDRTQLGAGNNILIHAEADNAADINATGQGGGFVGSGGSEAWARLINPVIKARLGNNATVSAPEARFEISAAERAWLSTDSDQTTGGAIADNEAKSVTQILNGQTLAQVGTGADVSVREFVLSAKELSVYAEALSDAIVPFDLGGTNTARAIIDVSVNAEAHIFATTAPGENTTIVATEKVTILGGADSVRTNADAFAKTTGLTGNLHTIADNDKTVNANVVAEDGTQITTSNLVVNAYAPHDEANRYTRDSTTEAQTAVNYVLTAVGTVTKTVCNVVGEVVCLWGLICDPEEICETITETIYEWVAEVLGAAQTNDRLGAETMTNSIVFNADVTIAGGADPGLVIGPDGGIVQKTGDFSVTTGANQIEVGDILNTAPPGSIVVQADKGSTSGYSNIEFNTAFNTVTVINQSNKNLVMNKVEVFNTTTPPTITHKANLGQKNWGYNLTTNATNSDISITNNSAADTDITLQGHILNPGGRTSIQNIGGGGGDILAASSAAYIGSRVVSLNADSGSVGTSANRVFVGLTVSGDGSGYT